MALIYKDITVIQETTWGASLAGDPNRLHIRSINLNLENEKVLVEDTAGTPKGRGRMVLVKNTYAGDITGYLTPRNADQILEWVNGSTGVVGSSMGTSGTLWNYYQNFNGTMTSKAVNIDRTDTQERYNGVRAKSLEISNSDSITEWTLGVIAKQRGSGALLAEDIGETVKPFTFADWTVQINAGNTIGTAPITHSVKQWNLTYDNQLETAFLSGSADPSRSDPKIPSIKGTFSIFHAGTSWTDANYGASEFYLRFQGTMPSDRGLIAGVTPYLLRIDVPRVQLTKSVRSYANGEMAMEEFGFDGIYDPGLSSLWFTQMTAGISVS